MTRIVTLGFVIFPSFPMACLTSAIEPLRAANEISGTESFRWQVLGETGQPVTSSAGVVFAPDHIMTDVGTLDYLFLSSSPDGIFKQRAKAQAWLQRHLRKGGTIGAFSGGVFPLARTGLMKGHPASVHWCYDSAFAAEFPDVDVVKTVICEGHQRLTVAGAAAVFDLMLSLIENTCGAEVMTEVACWFQHPFVRTGEVSQKTPSLTTEATIDTLPKQISKAIQMFVEHIEDPVQIKDVAEAVNMSTRSLERSFRRATGESPLKYYRLLRLKQARQLVLYSSDTLTEIAYSVGYASTAPMMKHYKAVYGVTPHEDRKNSNSFRVTDGSCLPSV
ncbi:Transcriptional regulator GlxA family, contains an amidase domain and an AraC-type DNA-binding HTH domain [Aliiroseovarius halocynthiae]|uniref:GlxA family transcriptional regulator n=1 Tax=Aliiroseovarius halocynthiae TaxID=985055 RepID=A0A545SSD3_9RHOB|nr:GlxA family transcriptional regulator [Aliiroseovarius halocynthiae]TQV67862.1 GlxA family transcriptional regulator [Aliiroseovarius halocynthiae]SMR72954.1 Transcriptional regulator GlxA family, contains an amidase domain and an AraC-type DNA-binding HTH domain [Aliiroseovarius halocynthiae]